MVLVLQLCTSMVASAPGHSLWILDWNMLPSPLSCLDSLLGYSTGELQALQPKKHIIQPTGFSAYSLTCFQKIFILSTMFFLLSVRYHTSNSDESYWFDNHSIVVPDSTDVTLEIQWIVYINNSQRYQSLYVDHLSHGNIIWLHWVQWCEI